ncbi:membrane protein insertion efficiency factor YidD [Sinomonas halotolerans]|uniref:Putative membrane protein insertion efficiency factor n=1 Tax=Sinomonas halotolerans TaxID=1644133 RepID=A0ABU9X236_9MICC
MATVAEPARPPRRGLAQEWGLAVVRAVWTFPQRVLILLLKAYRAVVSPLYGQVCRFFPSCSAYALEAVTVHGAVRGSYLAVRRLARCHPWNPGGLDPVPDGHRHWPEDRIPRIVVLNHPDRYWTDQPEDGEDPATTTRGM